MTAAVPPETEAFTDDLSSGLATGLSSGDTDHADSVVAEDFAAPEPVSHARQTLLKRLADVVCLPESRVNSFERAVTADLLVEMLREAQLSERKRVAKRLSGLSEVPNSLARLLLRDEIEVARLLIEDCDSLSEADLYYCARNSSLLHQRLLAGRKDIGPILAEVLSETGDDGVLTALLKNPRAVLSQTAIETAVAQSQKTPELTLLIIRRPELRPSSAYVMFWWAGAEVRRTILSRFAVNREIMQDAASDVFSMAARENWNDALSRKALQFIERRQRNREAIRKSPYESLEDALNDAATRGLTRHTAEEIAYLSGIKPSTGAKILRDRGGEGLAVLCKATGLKKTSLRHFWQALRRPLEKEGAEHPDLTRIMLVYDLLSVDRAQTVLRYWNWALSSALTPVMLRTISSGEKVDLEPLTVPERTALLAFAEDLKV